jgi:hypothetical protein
MIERGRVDRLGAALRGTPARDEIARGLQELAGGRWLCWFGHATGRYWALRRPPGTCLLIEGRTPEELRTAMSEIDSFCGTGRTDENLAGPSPQERSQERRMTRTRRR